MRLQGLEINTLLIRVPDGSLDDLAHDVQVVLV